MNLASIYINKIERNDKEDIKAIKDCINDILFITQDIKISNDSELYEYCKINMKDFDFCNLDRILSESNSAASLGCVDYSFMLICIRYKIIQFKYSKYIAINYREDERKFVDRCDSSDLDNEMPELIEDFIKVFKIADKNSIISHKIYKVGRNQIIISCPELFLISIKNGGRLSDLYVQINRLRTKKPIYYFLCLVCNAYIDGSTNEMEVIGMFNGVEVNIEPYSEKFLRRILLFS